jgi:hypothetical protein
MVQHHCGGSTTPKHIEAGKACAICWHVSSLQRDKAVTFRQNIASFIKTS